MTTASRAPTVWRTKLRSTVDGVDHNEQERRCFDNGIVGIGWHIPELHDDAPLEDVLRVVRERWDGQAAGNIERIATDAHDGDFVWVRNKAGLYRLGQFAGHYRYDASPAAVATDVHQVRPVRWAPEPLADIEVPGAVIRAFSNVGLSFSQIHDEDARRATGWIWEDQHGGSSSPRDLTPDSILRTHLAPYDVEDLVFVWMQVCLGFLAIPNARRTDTPAYEWTMVHSSDGHPARLQVKTGDVPVNLNELRSVATPSAELFAFATSGSYEGETEGVRIIESSELIDFAMDRREVLPPHVRLWFDRV